MTEFLTLETRADLDKLVTAPSRREPHAQNTKPRLPSANRATSFGEIVLTGGYFPARFSICGWQTSACTRRGLWFGVSSAASGRAETRRDVHGPAHTLVRTKATASRCRVASTAPKRSDVSVD